MTALATHYPELFALPTDERVALGQALLASAETETAADELPPAFLAELERRVADHRANPGSAIPWEVVKARLLARSKK